MRSILRGGPMLMLFFFVPEQPVGSPNVFGIWYKSLWDYWLLRMKSDTMEAGKRKPAGEIRNCEHSEMTIVNLFPFLFLVLFYGFNVFRSNPVFFFAGLLYEFFRFFLCFSRKKHILIQIQNTKRDKNVITFLSLSFSLPHRGMAYIHVTDTGGAEISLFYIRCCAVFRDRNWNCRWKPLNCKCRR